MRVLVTGAGGASGICTIQALKRNNWVFGCDCSLYSPGLYLAHDSSLIPPAKAEEFVEVITDIIDKHNIEVVFPNVDEELSIFADNEFPCFIMVSPFSTIEICNDKSKTMAMLDGIVPLPFAEKSPYFVKPKIGRGSRNIYRADSDEELRVLLKYLSLRKVELVIQEYLPGREYTVDAVFDVEGKLIVAVPRQRVRTSGGVSSVGIVKSNTQLLEFVKRISERLIFLGPINFQFKEDIQGVLKLIEINPRCSGGMAITCKSGINIPQLALDVLRGKKPTTLHWREETVLRYLKEINDERRDNCSVTPSQN